MFADRINTWSQAVYASRNLQFWLLQAIGWGGYSLVTFFALTVWDDNVSLSHVGHIVLQAGLGLACSWPLRVIYRHAFELGVIARVFISGLAVLVFSWLWTAARMETFMAISGERGLWSEFNDWYFGSVFVFLSWTALYFGVKYYQLLQLEHEKLVEESERKRMEQLRRMQAESSAQAAQLQMLRYQLNPHFLFNTLNALNALVRLEEVDKAANVIDKLSMFLRHTLDQETRPTATVAEELETVALYLDIEKARFEDRLVLEYNVDPAADRALVPSLLLQPLLENALKYAISDSETGGTIRIGVRVADSRLLLSVTDSGPGMESGELGKQRGIGLKNTIDRLHTLYHGDGSLETREAVPTGLEVLINIPLQVDAQGMGLASNA
ncbi:MAG: histidine kinase [Halieaceae bacterium]|jgi:sensor histidine kinase YesM|nr:histidine kinase [Halieaceae bacterium]